MIKHKMQKVVPVVYEPEHLQGAVPKETSSSLIVLETFFLDVTLNFKTLLGSMRYLNPRVNDVSHSNIYLENNF